MNISQEITKNDYMSLMNPLLKVQQVAQILNISCSFTYLLIHRGEIPTVTMGTALRIRPADLEQFIANKVFPERAE